MRNSWIIWANICNCAKEPINRKRNDSILMRNRLTFEFIDHRLPTLGISRQLYHPNQQNEKSRQNRIPHVKKFNHATIDRQTIDIT